MQCRHTLGFAVMIAMVAWPAASQQGKGPKTQVYIDVATHHMAGMPDMGPLGGFMMRRMGGDKGPQGYPESRNIPAGNGKFLDVAMYNALAPGKEAEQLVPAELDVGKSLLLMPPPAPGQSREGGTASVQDVEIRISQYWGCGAAVRPGQPKVFTFRMKQGQMQTSGSLAPGLFVPDRDIDATPSWTVWPNRKNTKRVSEGSSMIGAHQITGDGVPASLKFELTQNADFMPQIALRTSGQPTEAIALNWQPVQRARAYFISGMSMKSQTEMVMWSSSDVAGAGGELLNYLTGPYIDKWVKQKVLLPESATSCTVPAGIFAGGGNSGGMGGMGMLMMIAYGPETNIAWPPRPANPKQAWNPEWNVRVRTKSTVFALLGMNLDGSDNGDGQQKGQQGKRPGLRNALKGLLGGG